MAYRDEMKINFVRRQEVSEVADANQNESNAVRNAVHAPSNVFKAHRRIVQEWIGAVRHAVEDNFIIVIIIASN